MKHELIYDVDHGQRCAGWYLRTDDGEDLALYADPDAPVALALEEAHLYVDEGDEIVVKLQIPDTWVTANVLAEAICEGLATGQDDWDAPAFERARELTERAGCSWDFAGWADTLRTVEAAGVLGGVPLRFPKEG